MIQRCILLLLLVGTVLAACTPPGSEPSLPEPEPSASTIATSHNAAPLGEPFTVTVQLRDSDGEALPLGGRKVTFVASSGGLTPVALDGGSEPVLTVDTDDEGRASVTLTPTSADTITVRAYLGEGTSGPLLGSVPITVAPSAVEVDDVTVTYDGTTKTVTPRFYPPEASEGATIVYARDGVELDGPPSEAGQYLVTVTGGNGYDASITSSLTIEPRTLTVESVTWANKAYDGTTGATASSATLGRDQVVDGDDVQLAETRAGRFASAAVGTHAVEGRLDLSGAHAGNYRIHPQPRGTATITKAPVTLSDAVVAPKAYDGTTAATITGTLSGNRGSDEDVTVVGTFASANVGTDIEVAVELVGEDADNYALATSTTLTGDIAAKPLVLRPTPVLLEHGQELPAEIGFTSEGLVEGEAIASVELDVVGADAPYPTGTYGLRVANPIAAAETKLSNYHLTTPVVLEALTVVQAIVTITPTGPFSKSYGEVDPTFTYDVDGVDAGALTGELSRERGSNAGSYAIELGTLSAGPEYALVLDEAVEPFVIERVSATVVPDAGQVKTYGEADPTLSFTLAGLVAGDAVAGRLSREAGESVGTYTFDVSDVVIDDGAGGANYELQLAADAATFAIEPATLTIAPDAGQAKLLGEPDPPFSYEARGFTNGDGGSLLTGELARDAGEEAGVYPFALGTLSAGKNYQLVLDGDATFAVSSVALEGATVTYDGTPRELTAEFSPAGAEQGATVTYRDASGTSLEGAPSDVGTYTVTATAGPGYTGSATATLVIEPVALTVDNVEFADKEYDAGTGATLSATLVKSAVVSGDDVRLVDRLVGTFASAHVGVHDVVGNVELTGAEAGNYVIAPQPRGKAEITLRPVTLQNAAAADKAYDGDAAAEVEGALKGIRALDVGKIGFDATFAQTAAGTDISVTVVLTGQAAGNYDLSDPGLAASITPRPITITVADRPSKTYGESLALGTSSTGFTVANLASGESVDQVALASAGAEAQAPVQSYDVHASEPTGQGFDPGNYDVSYTAGTLQVVAREITITGTVTSWTYGDEPEAGDLAPVVASGSLPAFASLAGALERTDVTAGSTATFQRGSLDIIGGDAVSIWPNFEVSYAAYEITARPATITADYVADKTYGDTIGLSTVDPDYFSVTGLAAGESVDQVVFSSDGFAAGAPVAESAYDVDVSDPVGLHFDPGNYDLTFVPGSVTVVAREVTIQGSFTVAERAYDGTDAAPIEDASGLSLVNTIDGDDVALDPDAAYQDGPAVGEDKPAALTAESSLSGADADNYVLSLDGAPTSTGTVVKDAITFDVTIAGTGGATTVVYDGGTTFQPNVVSSVDPVPSTDPVAFVLDIRYGSATGPSRGSFGEAGAYTVTVTADDPRYEGTSVHDDLEVLPREIVIASSTIEKTFGDANPELWPLVASPNGLGAGDTFSAGSELAYAGSDDPYLGVGTYDFHLGDVTIRRDGNDVTSNYAISFATGFSITERLLTITPSVDQSKTYGDADPTFTYAASGFAEVDDASILTGELRREEGEAVATYAYTLGSLDAGANYALSIAPEPASFEITPRPLTLTAATTTVTYGDQGHDLSARIAQGALRDGDALSGSLAMPDGSVGTWTFGAGDAAIGRDGSAATGNYALAYATYEVEARPATVVPVADQSKTYGDPDPTFAYTIENWIEGDELAGELGRVDGEAVGAYAFTLGTLANPNYALSLPNDPAPATFAITARPIMLGATVDEKEYGDPDPDLSPVLLDGTTLRKGDVLEGALAHDGVDANASYDLNLGSVAVARSGIEVTANYAISFGTFTIVPKPVSFDLTNSDFMINDGESTAHVFLGDGESAIRGLEVASDPAGMDSFTFSYRRTHDENHHPVPAGQQSTQNINLLGSYVVTVTATDPNYVGATPLHVWVTDATHVAFTDASEDEATLGGPDALVTLELRNAAGNARPAGTVGLPISLAASGHEVTFRDAADGTDISGVLIASGAASVDARVHPVESGIVTLSAAPTTDPSHVLGAGSLEFAVNHPPTGIALSSSSVIENSSGTIVGTFSSADPDDSMHSYTLVSGSGDTDNHLFAISDDELLTASELDHESRTSHQIRVRTDDGRGGSFEEVFTIYVENLQGAHADYTYRWPSGSHSVTFSESTVGAGDDYGNEASDHIYELIIPSDANPNFTIDTCSGEYDSYLHLLDEWGNRIAHDDDGCGTVAAGDKMALTLTPGRSYYVVVDGWSTNEGSYTLKVSNE